MSCLFQSLGRLVNRDPGELRGEICEYLEGNPDLIGDGTTAATVVQWESERALNDYCRSMRLSSTWGGAVEIAAFVNMTGKAVVVHDICGANREGPREIMFEPTGRRRSRRRREVLHISWNGCHYEPLKIEVL